MREDLSDGAWLSDERDEPDVAAGVVAVGGSFAVGTNEAETTLAYETVARSPSARATVSRNSASSRNMKTPSRRIRAWKTADGECRHRHG